MTELDRALETLHQDIDNPKNQSAFYDLFLNATFFVPTLDEKGAKEAGAEGTDGQVLPLIIEAEGNDYLMLFDSEERLHAWAQEKVKSVAVPGHALAATTEPPLHWALNVGTPYSKQFLPDEIAWLRDVVERCTAEAAKGTEEEG
ncbi:MAG: hypothetical protein CXR31_05005 [Geobacter sp.]|nr:MAG: hypothetical protein CXR31_05005 [Geobacter sp.]